MCSDNPFTQRNKATKRAVWVEVGGMGGEGGLDKTLKRVVGSIRDFHKIEGVGTFCQLCKENLKTGCQVSSSSAI